MRPGQKILLYDGTCGFCDKSVQLVLKYDKREQFKFAALQSDYGVELIARHPELPETLDSLLLVEPIETGEVVFFESRGVIRICQHLGGFFSVFALARFLPRFLTDIGYRAIARVRHRIWGRKELCLIPDTAQRARFLS